MTLDLPGRHASRVHGDDLLVEARKPPLIPGDQLRVERAFPIARNTQVQLGILGQHRLLRIAIAVIGLARRRLAIEMVVQFRVQDALGQRFLQLVEKPILGKHLLRIAPRQKLVQRALLDRHSPPPAASLWPHTQDSRQSLRAPSNPPSLRSSLGKLPGGLLSYADVLRWPFAYFVQPNSMKQQSLSTSF